MYSEARYLCSKKGNDQAAPSVFTVSKLGNDGSVTKYVAVESVHFNRRGPILYTDASTGDKLLREWFFQEGKAFTALLDRKTVLPNCMSGNTYVQKMTLELEKIYYRNRVSGCQILWLHLRPYIPMAKRLYL